MIAIKKKKQKLRFFHKKENQINNKKAVFLSKTKNNTKMLC
jgi:hypothetical protein